MEFLLYSGVLGLGLALVCVGVLYSTVYDCNCLQLRGFEVVPVAECVVYLDQVVGTWTVLCIWESSLAVVCVLLCYKPLLSLAPDLSSPSIKNIIFCSS